MLFFFPLGRAKALADTVGGHAVALAELDSFHPEDGMILANTTSVGMQPNFEETPVSKVSVIGHQYLTQMSKL